MVWTAKKWTKGRNNLTSTSLRSELVREVREKTFQRKTTRIGERHQVIGNRQHCDTAFSGFCERDIYGLRIATPPEIATDVIRKRTWSVCELLQKVTADNIAKRNVDYFQGAARLGGNGAVIVSGEDGKDRELRAGTILIATGSRPYRPENISFDIPGVCDTDTILYRGRVPKDILIAGAALSVWNLRR